MTPTDESERLVAPNLSALAYERLERAIMEGEIKPGDRLSESALARRYGISRGPLREAIGQLEGRRLVERKSNLGARVVSLSNTDLIDLLVIRESLEGMACRMAASRVTPAQIAKLEALLLAHADTEAVKSGRGYFQGSGDADFHQVIISACGNNRLIGLLDGELYSLLRLYRHQMSMRPGRPAAALKEHRTVLSALKLGDGDKAEAAMRTHIRNSRVAVEKWLAADGTLNVSEGI
jgi:DNA-binding GntR family transcriptional regulator